jgi:hypothetical protein
MANKKIHNTPKNIQAVYYLLIFVSAGLLFWEKSKPDDQVRLWWMLLWFGVMIIVFFKATKNWAHDNPKPSIEELLEEAGQKKKTPEIKDTDIPDLNQMMENLKKKK